MLTAGLEFDPFLIGNQPHFVVASDGFADSPSPAMAAADTRMASPTATVGRMVTRMAHTAVVEDMVEVHTAAAVVTKCRTWVQV